jgi:plastocyanin
MQRKIIYVLLALILVVSLGACSSGSDQEGDSEDSQGANNADTGVAEVEISGFKFVPDTITIQAGMTVTWTNLDAAPHSSVGDNDEWDSGAMRKNDTFSYTFDTPGTYTYHDYYYPAMHGTIEVTE